MPRESLEETIGRLLDARDARRTAAANEEKDPKVWLSAEIRRGVKEVLEELLSEGRVKPGGQDDDEPGFLAKLVGG